MNDFFFDRIFVKHFLIRLKFKKTITFHFYHGAKLYGFLCRVLEWHPTPKDGKKVNDVIINPFESGRITYNPNDEYCFVITFLKDNPVLIDKLKKNLSKIPASVYPGDLTADTVELVEITELCNLNYAKQTQSGIYTLKFVTPLRMEKRNEDKQTGKKYFDPEYFDVQQFFKLLYKRISDLYKLNFGAFPDESIPENPAAQIIEKYFMWVDMPKESSTWGGIIGTIKFSADLNELWQKILWFGQFVNAGQRSAFGFGKYFLADEKTFLTDLKPVKTFLDLVIEKDNLIKAFYHIKTNSNSFGVDGITPEYFELALDENLDLLINQISSGIYLASDLQGVIIPKSNSKIRALAIPTVVDRVLQRAVVQILGDSIDHLLEENSFAYRKGLSRAGAARAINNARKNGYNFLVESDIQAFFDEVNWELLLKKLDILYGTDPVYPLLKQWIQSDVVFEGIKIKRSKGLPQGAVISPLLANLFLDEFDEALKDDFKLIRYSDDFIVLCKSKEQAAEALQTVKTALKNIDLQINISKTNIVSFEEGFQYLGYLFVKSVIIDKSAYKEHNLNTETFEISTGNLPAGSWLSCIDIEKLKPVNKNIRTSFEPINSDNSTEICFEKFPLYISNNSFVHIDSDSIELVYEQDMEEKQVKYPLNNLNSVIIIGANKITMPAVFKLADNAIPIYFCKPNGELRLPITLQANNFDIWLKQAEVSKDDDFVLLFASIVVQAKINNYKIISKRTFEDNNAAEAFNAAINKAQQAQSLSSLRGIEGSAAVIFFDLLKKSIPEEWGFIARAKNPPKDPVNAMLSFGYSILYHHISTALQIEGLNPQIGLYHQSSNRYFPLASDIQEEFRHIIDSLVLYIIRRNMVSLADFEENENDVYPCLMKRDFIRKFISIIEERLNVKFRPLNSTKEITYKQFFNHQAKAIKTSVQKKQMLYKPLTIR